MSELDMPDDEEHSFGAAIIAWIKSHCRCPEGALCGEPICLVGWQRDFISRVYDNPHAVTGRGLGARGPGRPRSSRSRSPRRNSFARAKN
jgi:hypothetical protein